MRLILAAAVPVLVLVFSCGVWADGSSGNRGSSGSAYYQMGQKQRAEFVTRARKIKLGDSSAEVVRLLGRPDLDEVALPKFPADPGPDAGFHVLRYYVMRMKKDSVNMQDQALELFFRRSDDRLQMMASSVPEIGSLNFPPNRPAAGGAS